MTTAKMTQRSLFFFWLPIAATWLMMAIEGPFLAAIIARLPDLKFNLAAYGIAFSLGLFFEAPIMMLISASVALVRNRDSFLKMRTFTITLNLAITMAMGCVLIPPIFRLLMNLLNLPPDIHRLIYVATTLLLAWPAAIGFRRFYQGILIRGGYTGRVAIGTIVRLTCMSGTALTLALMTPLNGAWVACAALSVGVSMEAFAIWLMARSSVRAVCSRTHVPEKQLTTRRIWSFYYPLAFSSIIALGIRPIVSFFIALCENPIDSLAVFPVVYSTSFIFVCFGISLQEVALAVMGDRFEQLASVRKFAVSMAIVLTIINTIFVFSPLAAKWFMTVSHLPPDLTDFALLPFRIAMILPALAIAQSIQRSVLVNGSHNAPITWATGIEVVVITIAMLIFSAYARIDGVVAAMIALVSGRTLSNLYLYLHYRSFLARLSSTPAS